MGHQKSFKNTLVTLLAVAAMTIALAPGEGLAVEATGVGPGMPPGLAGKGEGPWAKASSTLRRVFGAHSAHQQLGNGAPFDPGNPSVRYSNGRILIDAVAANGNGAALLADLESLGLMNGTAFGAVVSGFMPLDRLKRAVDLDGLRSVSASLKPQTNSAVDPTFGLVHDRTGAIAMNLIPNGPNPELEEATYTGSGIKIGVLSDTYDNNGGSPATNADDDLLNGDLPGGGAYVALHTPGNVDVNDTSSFNATGAPGSNTVVDTSQFALDRVAPEQDGSIRFNPTSFNEHPITAVVSYADSERYSIGSKPFTIETWVRFETTSTNGLGPILASHYLSAGDQRGWFLIPRGPGDSFPNTLMFWASPDGTGTNAEFVNWPWVPAAQTWYHVAVTRDENNDVRAFVDGQALGAAQPLNISIFNSPDVLRLSSYSSQVNNNRPFDGWMEDFRFVVGEALYTSNFTPPGALSSSLPPSALPSTNVVAEGINAGIDEGRAMMQLIHDVAPGASLSFHSAFNGIADFAQGIQDLADDGADVIVDDIIYFAEPMFQDGIVAQAVDNVVSQGVAYFSSAGNAARNSYESPFVSSGEPFSVGAEDRGTLHDFDPSGGIDYLQSVTIPVGATFTMVAQWDQPFASNCAGCPGAANDVDIYLVEEAPNGSLSIVTSAVSDNLASGEPVEILQFANSGFFFGTEFQIMIAHYDVFTPQHGQPGPPPTLMKYVWFGQSSITINEYATNSPASYGHANAVGAEAVGAAFYLDTPAFGLTDPLLESYSSAGGTPILFDKMGNPIAADVREKPEIVAPDGTNTTFFFSDTGLDPDTFPNFFGTSAAAPHAAAIAALMLEADPTLLPTDIYTVLEDTAIDMGPAGFDNDTGYGLIDADAALAQIVGGNLVPLAVNDSASTNQNTLVSIPVLANDALGNQPTTITSVTIPPNGTAVVGLDGISIDYTPDPDYAGNDNFDYTIAENGTPADNSTATVNVTVNVVDVLPDAVNDEPATTAGTATDEDTPSVGIAVLANDDLGNTPTTITAAGPGTHGVVDISPDGTTVTYTPAENYNGPDSFPYTITDADGDLDTATVTMTVNPVNDAPVADNDPTSTNEDTPVGFTAAFMLDGDTDVDLDSLTVTVVSATSFLGAPVTNNGGGNYTFTPLPNFNGEDGINYLVSDGLLTDTGTVTVTVNAVNDAPDVGSVSNQNSLDGDVVLSLDAATTDTEGDTLSYSIIGQPAGLGINVNTGVISGTIDGNASGGGPSSNGIYTVIVTASDATLSTDYQFAWTVTAAPVTNAAPVAGDDGYGTNEDTALNVPAPGVLGNDTDADFNPLTAVLDTSVTSGSLTLNADGSFDYTPSANFNGSDSFTYFADDGTTNSAVAATVTITVNAVNDAPIFNVDPIAKPDATEGSPYVGQTLAGEATDLDSGSLTYSMISAPAWLNVAGDGTLSGTPGAGDVGPNSFTVEVSDNGTPALTDTATLDINVTASGLTAPTVPTGVSAENAVPPNGTAVISWADNSDEAGYDIQREKQNKRGAWKATTTVATIGANVTSYVDASGDGMFRYSVRAFNGAGISGWSAWSEVPVTTGGGGNLLPVAVDDTATTTMGVQVNGNVLANDDQGDAPARIAMFDATSTNAGTVTMTSNGDYTYSPAAGFIGIDTFTYAIIDANGDTSAPATVTVDVTDVAAGITLSANGYKVRGLQKVDLVWSGAPGANVEVYRDTILIATIANDGAYTDNINLKGGGSYEYQICETGGGNCSNTITVVF